MKFICNIITSFRIIIAILFALLSLLILPKNDKGYAVIGKIFLSIEEEMMRYKL